MGDTDFIVREATTDDAPAMGRVHVQVWRETYRGIVPQRVLDAMSEDERIARWSRVLSDPKEGQTFWVATVDGALVGFCGGGQTRDLVLATPLEIYMINILKRAQGLGLGRRLIGSVARWVAQSGDAKIGLWVFVENHRARRFYQHLDGSETDIRQDLDFEGEKRPEMAVHWPDAGTLARVAAAKPEQR
jgi:GNAT superfamily N-acetyltransferase